MIDRLARTYPFLTGCGRIANLPPVARWVDRKFPDEIHGVLRSGQTFSAPGADHIGRAAWVFGDLDPKINRIAASLIQKGDTVVDLGGNIGLFSLPAAELVGPTGKVHVVEPQPDMVRRLERAKSQNRLPQMEIHGLALGSRDAVAHLSIPRHNRGAGSLVRRHANDDRLPVPVCHAGSFLSQFVSGRVRVVKMDVEGSEAEILRGSLGWFSRTRPDAVIFEAKVHKTFRDNAVVSLLRELGYVHHPILPSLRQLRLGSTTYSGSLKGVHDILALAPGVVGEDAMSALLRAGARFV